MVDPEIDHGRASLGDCLLDHGIDLGLGLGPQAKTPIGLRELDEVGNRAEQIRLGEALVMEQLLPLTHHPEPAVVHHGMDHGHVVTDCRRELLRGHLEAAVTIEVDDVGVRASLLCTDRGGNAKTHRAKAARGQPAAWTIDREELCGPHLVLADARHPDRILALEGSVELLDDVLRLQLLALHVAEGVLLAPALDVGKPVALVSEPLGVPGLDNSLAQGGQRALEITK